MSNKNWDYRVVRKESNDGSDEWYSVQEVYFDDETGEPMAQTIDLQIEGDTISEIRKRLEGMINCLEDPILDEQDITPTLDSRYEAKGYTKEHTKLWLDSIEWVCKICGKSTKNVDYDYIGSGTNHLSCELEIEMGEGSNIKTEGFEFPTEGNWIYESSDGGETIYRRKMGEDNREKIEKGL